MPRPDKNMIKIRNATLKDCRKCAELSRIPELELPLEKYISEKYFRLFVDSDKMFFVAEKGREIIGYVLGEPMKGNLANLGLLAVDRKFRGKGIGKKLIDAMRKRCDEKGLTYILLYAPKNNKKTLEFYREHGFKEGKSYVQFVELRK